MLYATCHMYLEVISLSLTDDGIISTSERKAIFGLPRESKKHHISDDPSLSMVQAAAWYHLVIAEHVESHATETNSTFEFIRLREKKSFTSIDHRLNDTVHYAHRALIFSLIFSARKYVRINTINV